MQVDQLRSWERIEHPAMNGDGPQRFVETSGNIGDAATPESSFLIIAGEHHLAWQEVGELIQHLSAWRRTGSLELKVGQNRMRLATI